MSSVSPYLVCWYLFSVALANNAHQCKSIITPEQQKCSWNRLDSVFLRCTVDAIGTIDAVRSVRAFRPALRATACRGVRDCRALQLLLREVQVLLEKALVLFSLLLALDTMHHSVEDVVDRDIWDEVRGGTVLVHTSLHEDRVPGVCGVLVELVGATDVRFRSVTNEVHRLRRGIDAVHVFSPLLQEAGGELEGANLWLTESSGLQLFTSDSLVHGLERKTKSTHTQTGKVMLS